MTTPTTTSRTRPARSRRRPERRIFGTVRKLPSGRYQATYTGPDLARHNGPTTYETKMAAEEWLAREHRLVELDEWTPPRTRAKARSVVGTTLDEYVAGGAIDRRRVRGTPLKPRTKALYDSQYRRLLAPTFGSKSLRSITPEAVGEWFDQLDPTKATQRAHAYSLLRALMAQAVDEQVVSSNPCRIKGAGRVARPEHHVPPPTPEQIEAIADAMPANLSALVLIAAWCGLRAGELMELRRRDVDVESEWGMVRVERAFVRVNGQDVVSTPKSLAGIRTLTIPPHMKDAVAEHLSKFVGPEPDSLLFARPGNRHYAHTELTKSFRRACEAAGRPDVHLHDLRHAHGTMAAVVGATQAENQARQGHSTVAASMRYQHAAQDRDREIARRLSRLAKRKGKGKPKKPAEMAGRG